METAAEAARSPATNASRADWRSRGISRSRAFTSELLDVRLEAVVRPAHAGRAGMVFQFEVADDEQVRCIRPRGLSSRTGCFGVRQPKFSRNARCARYRSDLTVPSGRPTAPAISLWDMPRKYLQITTLR